MPLMDRDEPKFAQATQEMIQRSDWIVPYFNGEYRFDKPILVYWMMRGFDALLGHNELAARMHSILCAAGVAFLLFLMARRWFNPAAGWWAGIGWLVTLQVLIHGQLCVADMALMLGLTLAQFGAVELLRQPETIPNRRYSLWFWMMVAGFSLGFLAKGPVALIVPALGWVMTWWPLRGGRPPLHRLQPVALCLVVLGISGLWGIPALIETNGQFFQRGIGEHVIERGIRSFNGRISIPGVYYLITSLFVLLPWSAWFPSLFRKREPDRLRRLLWGWFLAPFVVFAFYSTQLPHYVMPGFPAFLLLLFSNGRLPQPTGRFEVIWFVSLVALLTLILLAMIAGAFVLPLDGPFLGFQSLILGATLLLSALLALCFVHRLARPIILILPCLLALSAGGWLAGKALRDLHPIFRSVILAQKVTDQNHLMVACRYTEPSLVYYANHRYEMVNREPDAFALLDQHQGPFTAVFLLREWDPGSLIGAHFQGKEPQAGQDRQEKVAARTWPEETSFTTVQGFNGAKFKWVEILIAHKP
jgi:4-amino-4-deoxy-L-arabinose transferase-like glycosyltransferase